MAGWDGRGDGDAPPGGGAGGRDGGGPTVSVGGPPNHNRTNPLSPRIGVPGFRQAAAATLARPIGRGPVVDQEETYVLHPDTVRALQHPIVHDARSGHRYDHALPAGRPPTAHAAGGFFTDQLGRRFPYGVTAQQTGIWLENRCAYCHTHYGDLLVHGSGVLVVRCDRGECRRAGKDRTTIFYGAPPAVLAGVIVDPSWVGPELL